MASTADGLDQGLVSSNLAEKTGNSPVDINGISGSNPATPTGDLTTSSVDLTGDSIRNSVDLTGDTKSSVDLTRGSSHNPVVLTGDLCNSLVTLHTSIRTPAQSPPTMISDTYPKVESPLRTVKVESDVEEISKTLEKGISKTQETRKSRKKVDLDAKDYWKRYYRDVHNIDSSDQEESHQGVLKRKHIGGSKNTYTQAKRRRAAAGLALMQEKTNVLNVSNHPQGPIAARAEMEEFDRENDDSGLSTKAAQLRHLKGSINKGDPQAVQDFHLLEEATKSFGVRKCNAGVDGKWNLKGFCSHLFHHQVIGVRWMVGRELHPIGPNGEPPGPEKKAKVFATLIIAPKKINPQWEREIYKHCSSKMKKGVLIYDCNRSPQEVRHAKIVITTYAQIRRQCPAKEDLKLIDSMKAEGKQEWRKLLCKKSRGILFEIDWFRVVLDEAHAINNWETSTSKACRNLVAQHRWIMTGTPMTNNRNELFPHLDFLQTAFDTVEKFQNVLAKRTANKGAEDEESLDRMRSVYQQISLRRRVQDTLMGHPILDIPKPHPTEEIEVKLLPREKEVYQKVVLEFKQRVAQGAMTLGEFMKFYNKFRFCISHPALIDPLYSPDGEDQKNGAIEPHIQVFCRICRRSLKDPRVGECGHAFCRSCILTSKRSKSIGAGFNCPICNTAITQVKPMPTPYLDPIQHKDSEKKESDNTDQVVRLEKWLQGWGRRPGEDELRLAPLLDGEFTKDKHGNLRKSKASKRSRKAKKKPKKNDKKSGKKAVRGKAKGEDRELHLNAVDFLQRCDEEPWKPVPHGAKTKVTLELVLKWQKEAPNDKIIIFIQWLPMFLILGRMLAQNGIKFVNFYGEMTVKQQDRAIKAFDDLDEIKVMQLISISCGAHGLNLTAANRAIVFDNWWHKGLEHQAFARIHRIGQTKVMYTAKILAANTIDDKILDLQMQKEANISMVTEGKAMGGILSSAKMLDLLSKETRQYAEEVVVGSDSDSGDSDDSDSDDPESSSNSDSDDSSSAEAEEDNRVGEDDW
ncbi:P-loop containing nucleoside triphosphate hydrolase protein [Lasiosphaeria hispida]|uniref:P-loop containing nucleoside triphosphate hydrolase protein n=1 Tax=Lasiosphaeria hispida TaxID=260671 RepID=A0AAJ0HFZ5_9PEZI|nr:P-loop containing nucleoside triphosphate hydrolase protein [Lasiosphaeria hispida]